MKSEAQKYVDLLRQKNFRATPIRCALLEVLSRSEQPRSVDDLLMLLEKAGGRKEFDRVTVYRNINAFVEAGIVGAIDLGTGKLLYEFTGDSTHHHHYHVICEGCQKIEHLEVCGIEPHLKMLEKMGYKQLRHKLEFSGLCKACG